MSVAWGMPMDGSEVRRRRELKGYGRPEFAHRCRISRTYLSLLELNRRQPSPSVFVRICDALGVPEEEREQLLMDEASA